MDTEVRVPFTTYDDPLLSSTRLPHPARSPPPDHPNDELTTSGLFFRSRGAGSTVARFAGDTVHQRLAAHDLFKQRDHVAGLKRAFLSTDEDLRASASSFPLSALRSVP